MKTFIQYLLESKNTHLEHLEDEVLNGGIAGTKKALDFLRNLRNMLAGHTSSPVDVTVKWDGAPAIFCGINPENGKFFVGTKSVFNRNPKINYTDSDIDANHGHAPALSEKLKVALKYFPRLGIKGVIQGDLLFTKGDIRTTKIDGEKYLIFRPNTITYAVPSHTQLASKLKSAQIGVVFHTQYTGSTMESMSASFGFSSSKLKNTSAIWATDAMFKDESGMATMTSEETQYVTSMLSDIGSLFNKMNSKFVNTLASNDKLKIMIKAFQNSEIRGGRFIGDPKHHARLLMQNLSDRFQRDIDKLKSQKGKDRKAKELEDLLYYIQSNESQFIVIFEMQRRMSEVKTVLLRQLQKVKSLGTFLETGKGFQVTTPEGYVAIDRMGDAVKLVDRLEFSRANFTIPKSWG